MKTLIIMACSYKKAENKAMVKNLFRGQLFQMIRRLAEKFKIDYKVISGKYGLLNPNDSIAPYDMKIKTKKDISRIKSLVLPKLKVILKDYERIIVLLGKNYYEVVKPLENGKFRKIFSQKGLFGYLSLISRYNKLSKEEFLKEIDKKFKGVE